MTTGGARIPDGFADQILGLLDVLTGRNSDLFLAGDQDRGDVQLPTLVPAREAPELACGADIGGSGEHRVQRHIAVVERLVARLEAVFLKYVPVRRYDKGHEDRIDPGRHR